MARINTFLISSDDFIPRCPVSGILTHSEGFYITLFRAGLLILFLSFSGIGNAQNLIKASPPLNVNAAVSKSMDDSFGGFNVTWMAEENLRGYEIFFQMEGARTISFYCLPGISFDRTTDIYSATLDKVILGRGKLLQNDRRWRIGIRCKGKINNNVRISSPSDIVWSDFIAMTQ